MACLVEFEDYAAFLAEAARIKDLGYEGHSEGSAFAGCDSYDHALALAADGWPEGMTAFKRFTDEMEELQVLAPAPHWEHDIAGSFPDVPAMLAGQPAHMMQLQDTGLSLEAPVVRIIANVGARAGATVAAMQNRAGATMVLCEYLGGMGVESEIFSASHNNHGVTIMVPVKHAGQHIEPDRLMFALGHVAMHRRIGFQMREVLGNTAVGGSMKMPRKWFDQHTVCSNYLDSTSSKKYSTPEKALREMLKLAIAQLSPELAEQIKEDWIETLA